MSAKISIYLEAGKKRVFAGSPAWPGWARSGKDEAAAVEALWLYGSRYARVLRGTRLGYTAPSGPGDLTIAERLRGDATTDFGAPSIAPDIDAEPMDDDQLARLSTILRAGWRAFDRAVSAAEGVALTKGPRGGGRELDAIVEHAVGAQDSYARRIGRTIALEGDVLPPVLAALEGAVHDGIPPSPRGGKRWTPRYFVRRSAWHILDHAWEIEDRSQG
jgi:hypothetical protein